MRDDVWAQFASASIISKASTALQAAADADAMLAEFDQRFPDRLTLLGQLKPLVAEPTDDPITVVQKVLDACSKAKTPKP